MCMICLLNFFWEAYYKYIQQWYNQTQKKQVRKIRFFSILSLLVFWEACHLASNSYAKKMPSLAQSYLRWSTICFWKQTCLEMWLRIVLNPGRPPTWSSGGKYVAPTNGFKSGVSQTLIGQPPPPVIACNKVKKSDHCLNSLYCFKTKLNR